MILSILLALRVASAWGQEPDERKNVLLIIADDFRPNVGVLESENSFSSVDMVTPNLDKLAARSLVLTNAYTQVSVPCPMSHVTCPMSHVRSNVMCVLRWRSVAPAGTPS